MATIAIQPIKQSGALTNLISSLREVNKTAALSVVLSVLFISYFFIPHGGVFYSLYQFSMLYVVVIPIAALACAIIAVRQIYKTGAKGIVLSYAALGITTLYFMVALAIPVVLVGLYLLYMYVI